MMPGRVSRNAVMGKYHFLVMVPYMVLYGSSCALQVRLSAGATQGLTLATIGNEKYALRNGKGAMKHTNLYM